MDIYTLITKQLSRIDSLGVGFILLCIIVLMIRIKIKNNIKIQEERIKDIKEDLKEHIEEIKSMVIGFMKEVNTSIKDERKFNYQIYNNFDSEMKDVLKKLYECIGELRGKKNDNE